jgi:RNA ligase
MTAVVTIADILDAGLLDRMITDGYIRRQVHPALPLSVLNYSEKAVIERQWNAATRQCRGLVYNHDTGEVVARPLPKFWNHGEAEAGELVLTERAVVFDKADGSLAVIFTTPDGPAVATRGSFASDQAVHATRMLRDRWPEWTPPAGVTVLAEIVYPGNRIVVDYGDLDTLILLAAVDIATGRTFGPEMVPDWPGETIEQFTFATLAEAMAAPARDNREGFVVWFPDRDARVKIKYEAYIALHRAVTGLSARTVWEHLMTGMPLDELIAPLPDEFHDWVRGIADDIVRACANELERLTAEFQKTTQAMPEGWTAADRAGRKDFAMLAARHPDKWALFALLDGRDIGPEILKRARPEPFVTPAGRTFTEDTA